MHVHCTRAWRACFVALLSTAEQQILCQTDVRGAYRLLGPGQLGNGLGKVGKPMVFASERYWSLILRGLTLTSRSGEGNRKSGPMSLDALHRALSLMRRHNFLYNVQAQACPRGLRGIQGLE